jgi:hypothetical protein
LEREKKRKEKKKNFKTAAKKAEIKTLKTK